MKILYTTPVLEHPPVGGPQLRIENSIKALSQVGELHIISQVDREHIGGQVAEDFYKNLCHFFKYSPKARVNNHFPLKRSIMGLALRVVAKVLREAVTRFEVDALKIAQYAKENNIDVIWFGYGNISYPLMKKIKKLNPELKLICDTDSVWSRFVLREIPFEKNVEKRKLMLKKGLNKIEEEVDWVDFCDITTAVSLVDLEYYKSITPFPEKIKLFSNVIDLNNYSIKMPVPVNFKTPSIYLAGSFGKDSAMDKAARWVINDIFPILASRNPNLYFYIIGNGSKETLSDIKHERIIITGRLDSVLPYLCNTSIALVPLMFESGTRFKIMEAAACEVPIVSTTLGAEGIPVVHNKNILIADTSAEFVDAVERIINEPSFGKKLALNCKELILEHNSVQSLQKEAQQILGYLFN